jgi:hypothetical protein
MELLDPDPEEVDTEEEEDTVANCFFIAAEITLISFSILER